MGGLVKALVIEDNESVLRLVREGLEAVLMAI